MKEERKRMKEEKTRMKEEKTRKKGNLREVASGWQERTVASVEGTTQTVAEFATETSVEGSSVVG